MTSATLSDERQQRGSNLFNNKSATRERSASPQPRNGTSPRSEKAATISESSYITTEEDFEHLVFKEKLVGMDFTVHKEKRDRIAYEVYSTEWTYVRNLSLLMAYWAPPLQNAIKNKASREIFKTAMASVEAVLSVNKILLKSLTETFQNWTSSTKLAPILNEMLPYLKIYKLYTTSYQQLSELQVSLKETEPKFSETLDTLAQQPLAKGLTFTSYIVLPVQRIPRYVMLLTDLIKNTDPNHADYQGLQDAAHEMKKTADAINLNMKIYDSKEKVKAIADTLKSDSPLLEPHRLFIEEGLVKKQCRKDIEERRIYLFNDLIVLAKDHHTSNTIEERTRTNLEHAAVVDCPNTGRIQVKSKVKSYELVFDSPEDRLKWFTLIKEAIEKWQNRNEGDDNETNSTHPKIKDENKHKEDKKGVELAPVWTPDTDVASCPLCHDHFTALFRRHHCRKCGMVVCGSCSKHKVMVPSVKATKKVRVCDSCYEETQKAVG